MEVLGLDREPLVSRPDPWRHVGSHVCVSTHVQNPQHKQEIASANITSNHAITHAK